MLISSFKFPNAAPYDLFSFPYCIYSTANFTIDGRSTVFTIRSFDRFPFYAIDVDSFGSVETQINVNEGIQIEMKNQSLSSFATVLSLLGTGPFSNTKTLSIFC